MWEQLLGRGQCSKPGFTADSLCDTGYITECFLSLCVLSILVKPGKVYKFVEGLQEL